MYNNFPPVASCVLVELHADPALGHTVQLFYRNDSSSEPHQLQLPDCQPSCPWERFVTLTKDVLPGDLQAECAKAGDCFDGSAASGKLKGRELCCF